MRSRKLLPHVRLDLRGTWGRPSFFVVCPGGRSTRADHKKRWSAPRLLPVDLFLGLNLLAVDVASLFVLHVAVLFDLSLALCLIVGPRHIGVTLCLDLDVPVLLHLGLGFLLII